MDYSYKFLTEGIEMNQYLKDGNTIEETIECHITKMVNFLVEEDEGNAIYKDHYLDVVQYKDPAKTTLITCYMLYDGPIETPDDDFFDDVVDEYDEEEMRGRIENYHFDYLRYHGELPTIDAICLDMTAVTDLASYIWNEGYDEMETTFIETGQQSIGNMKNHLCWTVLNSLLGDYDVSLDEEKFFEYLKNEKPSWESFRSTIEKIIELYPVN